MLFLLLCLMFFVACLLACSSLLTLCYFCCCWFLFFFVMFLLRLGTLLLDLHGILFVFILVCSLLPLLLLHLLLLCCLLSVSCLLCIVFFVCVGFASIKKCLCFRPSSEGTVSSKKFSWFFLSLYYLLLFLSDLFVSYVILACHLSWILSRFDKCTLRVVFCFLFLALS